MSQTVFKRYELKYMIDRQQYDQLISVMENYMIRDHFAHSSIHNLYLDTPDYHLIKTSLEKPVYKEKIRIRSYGDHPDDPDVFVELKKKYHGVVYKRRIEVIGSIDLYGLDHIDVDQCQIAQEINYVLSYYPMIKPRVFLAYQRDSYQGIQDKDLRITFDTNMVYRDHDLSLQRSTRDHPLLTDDHVLMEVKMIRSMPLWLVHWLSDHTIYKTSLSKYGAAYLSIQDRKENV